MSKEFIKMQKLAGVITESQYKEKINEVEVNLLTPDGLHKFLHGLRNLINDKKDPLPMINKAISSIADKLNEIEGDPDDYYGYNEPVDPNDYADDNGDDKFTIIDGLIGRDLYDNFINAVEAIQDATIGQADIKPQDVYDYLIASMERDA